MQSPFLTPAQLATRWNTTIATLSQWRWKGYGPKFYKIGRRISYRIHDVELFEMSKQRESTSDNELTDSGFSNRDHCLDKTPQPLSLQKRGLKP